MRRSTIGYAIAAVALAALVLAIALTGSPPASVWRTHRLTPNQAASLVRGRSALPIRTAAASSDLALQPGIVRVRPPAAALTRPSAPVGDNWFSVPGHHH